MKKRKLFYKDISGLRFIGIVCIFLYVITYILFDQQTSQISKFYLLLTGSIKNIGISIFAILSCFLLTAHGLREYKYNQNFNLKHFYYRRLLKILPVLVITLLFYFVAHPLMVNVLKLTPINEGNIFKNLFLLPHYQNIISREVFIYLYFIYGALAILQFYILWGLVLKYAEKHLIVTITILFAIGIVFKIIGSSESHAYYLYLPFYFMEISIGALTAIIIRGDLPIIASAKAMSRGRIILIYIIGIFCIIAAYLLSDSIYVKLLSKLCLYALVGFYIIEQTFAKHSPFKVRNSLFIIQFGNLSYSFVMFLPIISIIVLIFFESVEIAVNSKLIVVLYPVLCLILTWIISYFFYHSIDRFFGQIRKEYK